VTRLALPSMTRSLCIRTRLAPGPRSWSTRLMLDVDLGSRSLLALECEDPDTLRAIHRAIGRLLADHHAYLPAAERRIILHAHP
jgi:hypothetical protein